MRILFSLFFLVTGLAISQNNGNKGGKVSRDLNGLDPNSSVDVVIQYVSPPNEDDDQLIKGNGGQRKLKFSSIKGVSASVPVKALAGLSHNPKIAYISRDRKVPSMLDVTALTVGAVTAWQAGRDGHRRSRDRQRHRHRFHGLLATELHHFPHCLWGELCIGSH